MFHWPDRKTISSLPHNALCKALESSLCAPAQHHQAEVSPGGLCLGTQEVLWMHLGRENARYPCYFTLHNNSKYAYFISPRVNPKRRLCWTHPGTAGTAEPACWCQPVLTLAAVAAAGLPLLQFHWSSLQLYAQASTWQEHRERGHCGEISHHFWSTPRPGSRHIFQSLKSDTLMWIWSYWNGRQAWLQWFLSRGKSKTRGNSDYVRYTRTNRPIFNLFHWRNRKYIRAHVISEHL